jgi:hydroxypyruvate reductase
VADPAADARRIWTAAVRGAAPHALLARRDWGALAPRPLGTYRRVAVVGAGKAAMAMAGAAERLLAERLPAGRLAPGAAVGGAVAVPHGYAAAFPAGAPAPALVRVREAGHPVPDAAGVGAAEEALALCAAAGDGDLVLALVSGGGSALWPALAGGIALDEARATFGLLLRSGADIAAMNTVRRHLSRVGGGRLAAAAAPADVLALVVSDVVGDDPSVVAGGPAAADPTTFADAAAALRAHGLWDQLPGRVRAHLDAGARGLAPETLKPGDPALARVRTHVVGTNADALEAARREAEALGYAARIVDRGAAGEARAAGAAAASSAPAAGRDGGRDRGRPLCLLWGGETTVTVRGAGRGGRNQEWALAAALELERRAPALAGAAQAGADVVLMAGGTDGVDGPTDAAGAWATPGAAAAARRLGLDPGRALADNDAHTFFAALGAADAPPDARAAGGLLVTGPTHTNVMDVYLALVRPAPLVRPAAPAGTGGPP